MFIASQRSLTGKQSAITNRTERIVIGSDVPLRWSFHPMVRGRLRLRDLLDMAVGWLVLGRV
jgi:hypothetical protein